jgi:vesicle transport through interaction with t-SNAREs protein 1
MSIFDVSIHTAHATSGTCVASDEAAHTHPQPGSPLSSFSLSSLVFVCLRCCRVVVVHPTYQIHQPHTRINPPQASKGPQSATARHTQQLDHRCIDHQILTHLSPLHNQKRYDEEYRGLTAQIQSKISDLQTYSTSDAASQCRLINGLLKQADDLIKQMDMEARGSGGDRELQRKTKTYKGTLMSLREDFGAAKGEAERRGLFGGASGGGGDLEMGQKGRLNATQNKLDGQNDTLDNARRVMAETEETALDITSELARNREKIQSSRDKVVDVSSMTNQARRVIQNMSKREAQQKMIVCGVGFMLLGAIVLIIYYVSKGDSKGK